MKTVYIYCEGQTEETFVNKVLYSYFLGMDIVVLPIVCETCRTASRKYRGGISSYAKIKNEIIALCRQHKNAFVTTMFDYYGMPDNTPFIDCKEQDIQKRMSIIEDAINKDIAQPNFRFHFMLHEFEAILFSNPESFGKIADEPAVQKIQKIKNEFHNPEHINNSPTTAPSKRIKDIIPSYKKITDGANLSEDMGIDVILDECPYFSSWVEMIKKW